MKIPSRVESRERAFDTKMEATDMELTTFAAYTQSIKSTIATYRNSRVNATLALHNAGLLLHKFKNSHLYPGKWNEYLYTSRLLQDIVQREANSPSAAYLHGEKVIFFATFR